MCPRRWSEYRAVALQLTIDGREVEHPPPRGPSTRTPAQRELVRLLRLGSLRTVEAGLVVHAHREDGCARKPHHGPLARSCCVYCSSDGLAAMRRLERRGLAKRVRKGIWQLHVN